MTISTDDPSTAGRVSVTVRRGEYVRHDAPAEPRLALEFGDLPGLQLTIDQAARLTGVGHAAAEEALHALAGSGLVIEGPGGAFRHAEPLPHRG
jgi:hypothetical protein